MFLKSLTLKGFKSFADSTTLEFQPGVTVLVGPNGSGKSNVVDAVAWVLGAQGPRTVRSSKMDDVVFAGSSRRPALGRAEVSLTIDNSAGLLPIGLSEVTITRTLFRSSGESEYSINGAPCRLLDVQELLSDTGVGRQQHVIVSQGQLDAVLDARAEDRRLVVEEAAGVLKHRRRREKAQRRLEATEGNLVRLQDLVREVRRQLHPLERQAEAARRRDDLVAELRGLRLHLAGRELAGLRGRLDAAERVRSDLDGEEAARREELGHLDSQVAAAEAALGDRGDDHLGEALRRCEGLRERARGVAAVLAERRRSLERDRAVLARSEQTAVLESESERLAAETDQVDREAAALVPQADELATAERNLDEERRRLDAAGDPGRPRSEGEAAEIRGALGPLRHALERERAELGRLESQQRAMEHEAARLSAEGDRLRAELFEVEALEGPLVEGLDRAEARRAQAVGQLAQAEEALRRAQTEAGGWAARAEALGLALDEARSRAGAELLAEVGGVVGTLLELVEVDQGWEVAFEAAAGEALGAVVVDGVDSARRALARLRAGDTAGAVLALGEHLSPPRGAPGQPPVPAFHGPGDPVPGDGVRARVRSRLPSVEQLLDRLLARAVVVPGGWHQALEVALAHPELVVVTPEGDRFGVAAWRTGRGATVATGAALQEARQRADQAVAAVAAGEGTASRARSELFSADAERDRCLAALDSHDHRFVALSEDLQRLESERQRLTLELHALAPRLAEAAARLSSDTARAAELEARLPALEEEERTRVEQEAASRALRSRVERRTTALAALRTDLEVRAAALEERRTFLSRRQDEVAQALRAEQAGQVAAERRRRQVEADAVAVERLASAVAIRLGWLDMTVARMTDRRRRWGEQTRDVARRLDELRGRRSARERELAGVRERAQRVEIEVAEIRLRLEAATESLRRELDVEPETATEATCSDLPPGTTPAGRVRELERELRLLGPVNALAVEEHAALRERHQFLEDQLGDVRSSRRELAKVIRTVDGEIVEVFAAAFADVADQFGRLFGVLFPGGTGRLHLTDPGNLLETGIEVEARPTGRGASKLSLLSGGERSLTALAFLFAVFRSRPSPFYLLDEVEAALDDINLHRFLGLLDEFRDEAQLLVVSHQKRTMEAADCLYGVTMAPGGASRAVSERVGRAERGPRDKARADLES